jgi:uncharacterized membrane protein YkvI
VPDFPQSKPSIRAWKLCAICAYLAVVLLIVHAIFKSMGADQESIEAVWIASLLGFLGVPVSAVLAIVAHILEA